MRLHLENLPPSLAARRDTLARCLEAMDRALPLREVYLFGSRARGDARPDSDVDLCLVAEGAERQLATAQRFCRAIWGIRGKPAFTLIPITPDRLEEKKPSAISFSGPCSRKECCLPRKTDSNNPADWLWIAGSEMEMA